MRVHILGICGTFMAGIALIAKEMGFDVSGQDENVYPPMSTLLEEKGIDIIKGYEDDTLSDEIDTVIVGNAMKRGMPVVETLLNQKIFCVSGPQWLYENVLKDKTVIAVSGTHGKTTTSAMVAWILESAGLNPGFLIGGVLENFGVSARLTDSDYFVIEADEYDTAFFDKRAKFVHYHPTLLSINNLEFDHADIYPDLDAILTQFHGLIRLMPSQGLIVRPKVSLSIDRLMQKGCWTETHTFGESGDYTYRLLKEDAQAFDVFYHKKHLAKVEWSLLGEHNVQNALTATALVSRLGVNASLIEQAFREFKNVKRRLEVKGEKGKLTLYDDFAHHPTAIKQTLKGLRAHVGKEKIIVLLECGSFTMREGFHDKALFESLALADLTFVLNDGVHIDKSFKKIKQSKGVDEILMHLKALSGPTHLVTMSNKGVTELHNRLLNAL